MFEIINILKNQGKQYIPDIEKPVLPTTFRGLPSIKDIACEQSCSNCADACPTEAILIDSLSKVSLDMGKCTFCGECVNVCPSKKLSFTNEYKIATNNRNSLIIAQGQESFEGIDPELIRKEIIGYFGQSLKLRQVSCGGDNADENELNACTNVNFDMGRFGIDWVASPRHADGIVISGPITKNMAIPLQTCYDAVPEPKIIILAGTSAISGGIFAGSPALDRSFLDKYPIDLYVPGYPPHPLTFINGVLQLIKERSK